MKNYYKILEITDFSDSVTIKRAFHKLSKLYHPDANPHYKLAAEMFKKISEAYSVLTDPIQKAAFDQQLKQEKYPNAKIPGKEDKGYKQETGEPAGINTRVPANTVVNSFSNFIFNSIKARNYQNGRSSRISLFYKIIYSLDIIFGAYLVFYYFNLDLSMVPKVYRFAMRSSWLAHYELAVVFQSLTSLYSLFQLVRVQKFKDSALHTLGKFFAAYFFISPMFGVTFFDISGKVLFLGFLWNGFMGLSIIVIYKIREEREMFF